MEPIITVRSVFDFRGETFCYESDIQLPPSIEDIDVFLQQLPNRMAKENALDVISYKFEMLESSDIEVIRFTAPIELDDLTLPMHIEHFLEHYEAIGPDVYLQGIAKAHQIDLQANPEVAQALKEAYLLGNKHKPKDKLASPRGWF